MSKKNPGGLDAATVEKLLDDDFEPTYQAQKAATKTVMRAVLTGAPLLVATPSGLTVHPDLLRAVVADLTKA